MRKIFAGTLLVGAAVTTLTAAPASADCVEIEYHRIVQVTSAIFVEAPKSADTNPSDCFTTVVGLVPGGV